MTELVMMALGDYRFGLATAAYDEMRRVDEYRWQQQARLGRTPAQQFIGPGTTTIEFEGTIYPHFRGGLGQVDAMRVEAAKGEPLRLADAFGFNWGKFVIKRIEETRSRPMANGVPRKMTFRIELTAYGDDDDGNV